jgi:hypothetical protein
MFATGAAAKPRIGGVHSPSLVRRPQRSGNAASKNRADACQFGARRRSCADWRHAAEQ